MNAPEDDNLHKQEEESKNNNVQQETTQQDALALVCKHLNLDQCLNILIELNQNHSEECSQPQGTYFFADLSLRYVKLFLGCLLQI